MGESPGGAPRDARAFKFNTFGLGTKRKGHGSVEPGPFFMPSKAIDLVDYIAALFATCFVWLGAAMAISGDAIKYR